MSKSFAAYYPQLPAKVLVTWVRDGGYLIGSLAPEDTSHSFMTQGRTPEEFIELVNEAIFAAYEIPAHFRFELYSPQPEEKAQLAEPSVERSVIELKKGPLPPKA